MNEILDGLQKALLMRIEHAQRQSQKPKLRLLVDAKGVPMFHSVKDTLGDLMRVYRAHPVPPRVRSKYDGDMLRAIRAEKGVGRPLDVRNRRRFLAPMEMGEWRGIEFVTSEPAAFARMGVEFAPPPANTVENVTQALYLDYARMGVEFVPPSEYFVSAVEGGVYLGELDVEAMQAAGPMQFALRTHGSQRAAAKALGIALSTFQRRLAKEKSCVG